MSVFVCGDFHGALDIRKITRREWSKAKTLTKVDTLIQLGDFGLVWSKNPSDTDKYWLEWLDQQSYTFAFVDGNHENFELLEEYPTEDWNGGTVRRISENVIWLLRGEVYTIEGNNYFALGGAASTDKEFRRNRIEWWKEELWSYDEEDYIFQQAQNNHIDVVVSHTCPTSLIKHLCTYKEGYDDPVSKSMEALLEHINPQMWHFGHFHVDTQLEVNGIKYFCHYNRSPMEIVL